MNWDCVKAIHFHLQLMFRLIYKGVQVKFQINGNCKKGLYTDSRDFDVMDYNETVKVNKKEMHKNLIFEP